MRLPYHISFACLLAPDHRLRLLEIECSNDAMLQEDGPLQTMPSLTALKCTNTIFKKGASLEFLHTMPQLRTLVINLCDVSEPMEAQRYRLYRRARD